MLYFQVSRFAETFTKGKNSYWKLVYSNASANTNTMKKIGFPPIRSRLLERKFRGDKFWPLKLRESNRFSRCGLRDTFPSVWPGYNSDGGDPNKVNRVYQLFRMIHKIGEGPNFYRGIYCLRSSAQPRLIGMIRPLSQQHPRHQFAHFSQRKSIHWCVIVENVPGLFRHIRRINRARERKKYS